MINPKNACCRLDSLLPQFQFSEYHETVVARPVERVFPLLKTMDFTQSRTIRFLFRLRGLPRQMGTLQGFLDCGFMLLEEISNEELVIGFIIGRGGLKIIPPAEFKAFSATGHAKGVWNFHLETTVHGCILSTETRVQALDMKTKLIFGTYWFFISRFSGLIRRIMLKRIKNEAETTNL